MPLTTMADLGQAFGSEVKISITRGEIQALHSILFILIYCFYVLVKMSATGNGR